MRRMALLMLGLCLTVGLVGCKEKPATTTTPPATTTPAPDSTTPADETPADTATETAPAEGAAK
jgi:hypothetical protein